MTKRGPKTKWTEYEIRRAASRCRSHKQFRETYWTAYLLSKRLGLFEEITCHMSYDKNPTRETSTLRKQYAKAKWKKNDKDWYNLYMKLYRRDMLPRKSKKGGAGWLVR